MTSVVTQAPHRDVLVEEDIEELVQKIVDQIPPLTSEQKGEIGRILDPRWTARGKVPPSSSTAPGIRTSAPT